MTIDNNCRDDRGHMHRKARLLIAASETDADILYVSGLFVPDPFIVIGVDHTWHGIFSPLEIDRARKTSRLDEVHLDTPLRERAIKRGWEPTPATVAAAFLHEHGITDITVPACFPVYHADRLRDLGFRVSALSGSMFPERAIKTEHEIACLRRAVAITRRAMRQAVDFLAAADVGDDGILRHPENGIRLKSHHVRRVIETFLIGHGASPAHTIVACGRESADPHNIGHGLLRTGQPIIIDIFPRVLATGYWGDMTRTFIKGRASPELRHMYKTVREGQDIGFDMLAAGVNGADIHRTILAHFESRGFKTGTEGGRQAGFFHGTGHGLGLEIHEPPRISMQEERLEAGQVVTIEPGLYYPGIGGIRLEDVAVIQQHGADNLTRFARRLVIP